MKPSFVKTIVPKAAATALVSLCLLSANAMANDAVVGAIIGGGAGAFVGQSIGGRNATVIGGALGAAAGAAIGSDRGRSTYVERRVEYMPPPPPRIYYQEPLRVIQAPGYYGYGPRVQVVPAPVYYVRDKHFRDRHHDRRDHRDWRYVDRRFDRHD